MDEGSQIGGSASIRATRRALGLSIGQVADELGLAFDVYLDVERGKTRLPAAVMGRLADLLGLDPSETFGADQGRDNITYMHDFVRDRSTREGVA